MHSKLLVIHETYLTSDTYVKSSPLI